ncbi:MAG: amylo-alpha-1,6-glucosidase, partial [Patescibacteria group bacterium]
HPDYGILAGRHHFTDLWARDSLFATFGTNLIAPQSSRNTIETFLQYQRSDGLIPYLIARSPTTIGKYFGKPRYFSTPVPSFRSHVTAGLVLDGGLMTVIAVAEYYRVAKDKRFLYRWYDKLKKTIDWYALRFGNQLLSEWFGCEWADSVLKIGKTLYTNVLYWKALGDIAAIARLLGKKDDVCRFESRAKKVGTLLQAQFWNGTYFADWVDYKRHDYFAAHPNMLAIAFGLTDPKQSASILRFAQDHALLPFTLEENIPRYPVWRIPLFHYLVGLSDYHNYGCRWLQPGIWYALCLWMLGQKRKSRSFFGDLSNHIVKHNGVYEIYEKTGEPVRRRLYQSEYPFAWSAGLYVHAYKKIMIQ